MTRRARAAISAVLIAAALLGRAFAAAAADDANGARLVALVNPGFEASQSPNGQPPGWTAMQHAGVDAYAFTIDRGVRHSGAQSLRIARVGAEPFGSIVQSLADSSLRGRTVRFSAWLRTEDASTRDGSGGGALIVQAMHAGTPIAYDHMRASPVKGTTDWRAYSITLAIPERAEAVEVGAMLVGPGTLWVDDAMLEVVAP